MSEPVYIFDQAYNVFFEVDHDKKVIRFRDDASSYFMLDGLPLVPRVPEGAEYYFDLPRDGYVPAPIADALLSQQLLAMKHTPNLRLVAGSALSKDMQTVWDSLPENLADALPLIEEFFPPQETFMDAFVKSMDMAADDLMAEGYNLNAFVESSAAAPRRRVAAGRTTGAQEMVFDIRAEEMEPIPFDPKSAFSAFQTYADWSFAWWREIFQNSVDAIMMRREKLLDRNVSGELKGKLDISYKEADDYTVITVRDNGIGMNKKMLYTALLSFGGSGKGGVVRGATGGFGKAKELIFVPWIQFKVETVSYDWNEGVAKKTEAVGRHFERQRLPLAKEVVLEETRGNPSHKSIGTTIVVVMGKEKFAFTDVQTEEIKHQEYDYRVRLSAMDPLLERSYIPGIDLTINGERHSLLQGPKVVHYDRSGEAQEPARQQAFAFEDKQGLVRVFVDKKKQQYADITVRQNGLYMFSAGTQPQGVKGTVRIECSGSAIALYTDNRDRLKNSYYIDQVVQTLATDGIFGLRKDRRAVTLGLAGTDISHITDERILQVAQKKLQKLEGQLAGLLESNTTSLAADTTSTSDVQFRGTAEAAEERRAKLKTEAESILLHEFKEAETETAQDSVHGSPEWAAREWGRTDPDTIKQTLSSMPVRLTPEQFFMNNFWRPKQVIHSDLGTEVIQDRYWIRPSEYPEKYPFMLLDLWTNLVRLCAVAIGVSLKNYATGFVFSWEENGNYAVGLHVPQSSAGPAILINPVEIDPTRDEDGEVIYKNGAIKSFKLSTRWRLTSREDLEELLAIAVHEVTHAQGYAQHNDKFASALTYNMAVVMSKGSRMLGGLMDGARKRWQAIAEAREAIEGPAVRKVAKPPAAKSPAMEKYGAKPGRRRKAEITFRYELTDEAMEPNSRLRIGTDVISIEVTKLKNIKGIVVGLNYAEDNVQPFDSLKHPKMPIWIEILPAPNDSFREKFIMTIHSGNVDKAIIEEVSGFGSLHSKLEVAIEALAAETQGTYQLWHLLHNYSDNDLLHGSLMNLTLE